MSKVLASVACVQPDFMGQVVVEPYFGAMHIRGGQGIARDLEIPEKLLHAEDRLEAPNGRIRTPKL